MRHIVKAIEQGVGTGIVKTGGKGTDTIIVKADKKGGWSKTGLITPLLMLVVSLTGCSGVSALLTGNGSYSYEKRDAATGKPVCKLRVDSGRIVNGVSVKACGDLEVTADNVQQGNSAADVTELLRTVSALAAPVTPAPAPETPSPDLP